VIHTGDSATQHSTRITGDLDGDEGFFTANAAADNLADNAEMITAFHEILMDVFKLYLKTQSFSWHMSGPDIIIYQKILNEHTEQMFAMIGPIADRLRTLGSTSTNAIAHITQLQRELDNDSSTKRSDDMLMELHQDNSILSARLHRAHQIFNHQMDFESVHLLDSWIDQTRERSWFFLRATRPGNKRIN